MFYAKDDCNKPLQQRRLEPIPEKGASQVAAQLEALRNTICRLSDSVHELEVRLMPVLRDAPPVANGEEAQPCLVPLASAIRSGIDDIEQITRVVASIHVRLEV